MPLPPSSPYYGLTGWPNGGANSVYSPCPPQSDLALGNALVTLLDTNGFIVNILDPSWAGGTVTVSYDAATVAPIFIRSI
jgi:hypothetical protein